MPELSLFAGFVVLLRVSALADVTRTGRSIMREHVSRGGFTLIEVITVLLLCGIVAAVLLARTSATDTARVRSEADTLRSHLRFAQLLAMNDLPGVQWGIDVSPASYRLVMHEDGVLVTPTPHNLPNENSDTHVFESGVSATAVTILFDQWGSPSATSVIVGGHTISVTSETGYIP